jgi:hypothetical protein
VTKRRLTKQRDNQKKHNDKRKKLKDLFLRAKRKLLGMEKKIQKND